MFIIDKEYMNNNYIKFEPLEKFIKQNYSKDVHSFKDILNILTISDFNLLRAEEYLAIISDKLLFLNLNKKIDDHSSSFSSVNSFPKYQYNILKIAPYMFTVNDIEKTIGIIVSNFDKPQESLLNEFKSIYINLKEEIPSKGLNSNSEKCKYHLNYNELCFVENSNDSNDSNDSNNVDDDVDDDINVRKKVYNSSKILKAYKSNNYIIINYILTRFKINKELTNLPPNKKKFSNLKKNIINLDKEIYKRNIFNIYKSYFNKELDSLTVYRCYRNKRVDRNNYQFLSTSILPEVATEFSGNTNRIYCITIPNTIKCCSFNNWYFDSDLKHDEEYEILIERYTSLKLINITSITLTLNNSVKVMEQYNCIVQPLVPLDPLENHNVEYKINPLYLNLTGKGYFAKFYKISDYTKDSVGKKISEIYSVINCYPKVGDESIISLENINNSFEYEFNEVHDIDKFFHMLKYNGLGIRMYNDTGNLALNLAINNFKKYKQNRKFFINYTTQLGAFKPYSSNVFIIDNESVIEIYKLCTPISEQKSGINKSKLIKPKLTKNIKELLTDFKFKYIEQLSTIVLKLLQINKIHGDLHSGNIVICNNKIKVIDLSFIDIPSDYIDSYFYERFCNDFKNLSVLFTTFLEDVKPTLFNTLFNLSTQNTDEYSIVKTVNEFSKICNTLHTKSISISELNETITTIQKILKTLIKKIRDYNTIN